MPVSLSSPPYPMLHFKGGNASATTPTTTQGNNNDHGVGRSNQSQTNPRLGGQSTADAFTKAAVLK